MNATYTPLNAGISMRGNHPMVYLVGNATTPDGQLLEHLRHTITIRKNNFAAAKALGEAVKCPTLAHAWRYQDVLVGFAQMLQQEYPVEVFKDDLGFPYVKKFDAVPDDGQEEIKFP